MAYLPLLVGLALAMFLFDLGRADWEDGDEAEGPQIIQETLRGSGWVLPLHNGRRIPERNDRGYLVGSVSAAPASQAPIVVFAYRNKGDRVEVVDARMLPPLRPYDFSFNVPAGVYRLAAFEYHDAHFHYDPTRARAALYHDGEPVSVMPGQTVDRLYLKLLGDRPQRIEFEFILPGRGGGNALQPSPGTSANHQSP